MLIDVVIGHPQCWTMVRRPLSRDSRRRMLNLPVYWAYKILYMAGPWSGHISSKLQSTGTLVTSIENGVELDQQPSDKTDLGRTGG
eukprot:scaffold7035_cov162-Skeletonema_dohrnii-CCMP3373.AAC.2